jgi:uncharacterized delta-60 repeat protein
VKSYSLELHNLPYEKIELDQVNPSRGNSAAATRRDSNGGGETLINIPAYEKLCHSWGCPYGINALAVQPDGKILIGGFRTTILCNFGGCRAIQRPFVARLHSDGRYDGTFPVSQFGTQGEFIRSLMVQPDGRILVVRCFEAIDGQARPGVARLNPDGSPDGSFDPGMPVAGETVATTALTVQPYGRVLMGTDYFTSEQVVRHEIARLNQDGSLDATFNAGTDARVDGTMVQPDETRVSARNSTAPRRRWRPPFRSTSSWAKHASITASRWTSDSCSHAFWSLDPGQICFLMDANSDVVALGLPRI